MSVDKKVLEGRLRLVLLRAIGQAVVSDSFDPAALTSTLSDFSANPEPASQPLSPG